MKQKSGRRRLQAPRITTAEPQLLRVLLLEDDDDTRDVLELLLCPEEGFTVETCGDVTTCVEWLAQAARESHPFDVLLLDLLLPDGHSGAEVLEICQAQPHLRLPPVVVCTALSTSHIAPYRPILEACHASIVGKPFDADALMAELRSAARRAGQS